jgi:hypothetical protein
MKTVFLAVAFAALTSAAPSPVEKVPYSSIKLIRCGRASGTLFQVAPGVLMTAAHVTRNGPCSVDDVPLEIMLEDNALDYALLRGTVGQPMTLLCKEMKRGRTFYGIGYAGGRYRMDSRLFAQSRTKANVEGTSYSGMMRFGGGVIPGMSGGPVIDGEGRVVAIVNASNAELSTALGRSVKDTILCR